MNTRQYLVLIICLLLGVAAPARAQTAKDGIVVIVSIDGLAHYYLDDPSAAIPTLKTLIAEGTRATMMRAAMPSVTWPNHTSIITGDEPARHGVVSNEYFDRSTGKVVRLITDPEFDKDQIVKVPTLYDVAKEAGLTTASVCWPASRRAKTLDWAVPDVASEFLWETCATPGLMEDSEAAGIPFQTFGPLTAVQDMVKRDKLATDLFTFILHKHHPQLALLHIANVDHTQHEHGPQTPEAYAAVKGSDAAIAEVLDELKADYPGKATLLVVSDHGFFPYRRVIFPNVVLRDAGLVEVKGPRAVGGAVHVLPQGGCAMIYVTQPDDRAGIIDRTIAALKKTEGIGKIIRQEDFKEYGVADPAVDPHAPDLIVSATSGYIFGNVASGTIAVTTPLDAEYGAHGYDREEDGMHAVFIAWGAGIKPGVKLGEIHNTDVAPTAAKLLGITMKDVDGRVLDEILAQ